MAAELSGELSICLKTLVLLGNALELFFGAVRAIIWLCESFGGPDSLYAQSVQ